MCFRLPRLPCVLGLLVLAVILGRTTCSRAAEQKHGRPIEFSDPKGADVNTNLNVLDLKRGGLRDMEEDLSKFFPRSFSPGSSLDGLEPAVATAARRDFAGWHFVALNSNCAAIGGCGTGSAQEKWLRADLAATSRPCTLAYEHHPRFSGGINGSSANIAPMARNPRMMIRRNHPSVLSLSMT